MGEDLVAEVEISTRELKAGIKHMINPYPFVLYYGSDLLVEKALTPKDPASRLYMYGKKQSGSDLVVPVSVFKAMNFPLSIPNLVVHIEKKWSIPEGFILKAIGKKLADEAICILSGSNIDELIDLLDGPLSRLKVVKVLTNSEHFLVLAYQQRIEKK